MTEIRRYVLVDKEDNEEEYEYDRYVDALTATVGRMDVAIIARTYEYTESELVWTPDGSHVWYSYQMVTS